MKIPFLSRLLFFFSFFFLIIVGFALGYALAETKNIKNTEYFTSFDTALPTKLLDINGELITEFSSDENRKIITLSELNTNMINALLTREDKIFYAHKGFSVKAVIRAFIGQVMHRSLGGGSTLTQQIAGTLFCDRTEMSIKRKLKELWWALQMERRYSKNEILELYLNKIYFGGGTYGVSAASSYYFGHEATSITPAEAAMLVIQLSNPAYYNPFDHPNRAQNRQHYVLNEMVTAGYLTQEEADSSYNDFWASFDYTRTSIGSYYMKEDKAPWFSEYARRELSSLIYGSQNIYTAGFTVNTTLNLKHQAAAERVMDKYIKEANARYKREHANKANVAFNTYVPLTEALSLIFNFPSLRVNKERTQNISETEYLSQINPILDVASLVCGLDTLKMEVVNKANTNTKKESEKTLIEGTMVCIENNTGYITALVGGSKFDNENQFIRATQAKLQPGSTFKPLYYTEAIDSRALTPASIISDTPVVFHTADGRLYIPQNFKGEWLGDVPLYYALIHSMNVPSLKVLDKIGFDSAIKRAVSLLGISQEELPSRAFNPVYPLGLGVCSVRPIELARAYSVIASGGRAITPIAIRNIQDRKGNIIINPELELRKRQQKEKSVILNPDTAFVMTKIMEQTVQSGTLSGQSGKFIFKGSNGARYSIPAAGKTGTTQNWADAWTSGFTPYYTSTFWFGFDRPGQSLGLNITGSTLAGYAWGDFMHEIHEGLLSKQFPSPSSGVIQVKVCSSTGLLPTEGCAKHTTTQWFLLGTQPVEYCNKHMAGGMSSLSVSRLKNEAGKMGGHFTIPKESSELKLNLDFLNNSYTPPTITTNTTTSGNFLMDDIDEAAQSFITPAPPLPTLEDKREDNTTQPLEDNKSENKESSEQDDYNSLME